MLAALVVAIAFVTLGSFSWALRAHFRAPDGTPPGMLVLTGISMLAGLLFAVLVLSNGIDGLRAFSFTALSILAMSLFWWAIETTRRRPPHVAHSGQGPDMIYEQGPYTYVRHPFYLAYCLFWLGTAVGAGGLQWPVAGLLIAWYYTTARMEENDFLKSSMARPYTEYRRRTGMIFPRLQELRRR